jgi:hypothetical protein
MKLSMELAALPPIVPKPEKATETESDKLAT